MHVMKCGKSDYGKVKAEALREEGYHSKSGTIDRELSHLNYSLTNNQAPEDIDEYIKSLGVKRKIRADAVRLATIIVDYPKDEVKPDKEYFEDVVEGLKKYFDIKDESVIYAEVHKDEGHPHLHFAFVPVKESVKLYKDGHGETQVKLAATEFFTLEKLRELHPWMQRYMDDRGYRGTLHHNDGVKRDKIFLEHKLDQIEREISEKQALKQELSADLEDTKGQIKENEKKAVSIIADANDKFGSMMVQLDEYESEQKKLIDEEVETLISTRLEPIKAEISVLEQQRDDARTEADKIRSEAYTEAQKVKKEALSFKTLAHTILANAKAEAEKIIQDAKDTIADLKAQIEELTGKRDKLQAETSGIFEEIDRRLGIVSEKELADAWKEVEQCKAPLEEYIGPEEQKLLDQGDISGFAEAVDKKLSISDMRGWALKGACDKYQKLLDSPKSVEDVKLDIEKTLSRANKHHHYHI